MIMSESNGQIHSVGDGGKSMGLMQVQILNGETGIVCNPYQCSPDQIRGMVEQGVLGTTRGDGPLEPGIAFYLQRYDVGAALRWYNSGQLPNVADYSEATAISTPSYVSNIANRLMGLPPDAVFPDPSCNFSL